MEPENRTPLGSAKVVPLRPPGVPLPRLAADATSAEAERERRAGRTIAVTSGKGGVGKTCLTVNLAIALARCGLRVAVVDADLGLANVDTMLGLQPRVTLRDVVRGSASLDDVLLDGPAGITVVPAASGFEEMARLGGAPVAALASQIDGLARRFDVTLVDTSAGLSPVVLGFVLAAEERIVVATPEPTSLTDAYALIKVLARRYGQPSFDVLVNMARSQRDARRAQALLARVTERFLGLKPRDRGFLPYDPELPEAVRRQCSVIEMAPRSPVSVALQQVARGLAAGASGRRPGSGTAVLSGEEVGR